METIKSMYKPEEVVAEEKKEISEQDDSLEKEEMALSQLYFVKYAAEEIIEYIEEMDGEVEEWYQNKLSKVHSDMESLHSHVEGEKRRLKLDDEEEEEEEDEDEDDEMEEQTQAAHKVSVTVSDPNHPMVSKRDEKMEKRVIVNADNKDHAVVKAKEFYKKKGLKVHDANYHSPQAKSSMKTEENIQERNKENAMKRKSMDAARGARYKVSGNPVPDRGPEHKTGQAHNKAIGRALRSEEQEIDEGKSGTGYDLYHKDFSSAMAHAYDFAKNKFNIEIDPDEIDRNVAMGPKKPSSGKTNAYRLLDKTGKKAIQVQVTNLDNKRYELNMYKEGYGTHPSQRVDPRTGKRYVPPKSPLGQGVAERQETERLKPPFTPDKPKKNPPATAGKYGQGPSTAKHLAKTSMNKQTKPVKEEVEELDEDFMTLGPVSRALVGLAAGLGMTMVAIDFWFGSDPDRRKPIERGLDKAEKDGNAKLYHSLAAKFHQDIADDYKKKLQTLRTSPQSFYKKDSVKSGAKAGDMKKFYQEAEKEYLSRISRAEKKVQIFNDREKSGAPIARGTFYWEQRNAAKETPSLQEAIRRVVMNEKMHPNQKKLDVDGDGDIEADDLADLRAGKHKKKEEKVGKGKEQIDLKPKLDEKAPVAPVPDRKYIKGTPEYKAYMATKKTRVGHPTNQTKEETIHEEEMSDADMKKREEIVKSLKKRTDEFKDRYGDRWKEVMYATATKMAMK
jgi:hypothetical protein